MNNKKIAFMMVVGPNESRMAIESLDSIRYFYPNDDIWILDDCTNDGTFNHLKSWAEKNRAFINRNKKPNGYLGLVNSLFSLFLDILNSGIDYEIIIKMDTDAYILSSDLKKHIIDLFEENGPGMMGSYKFSPNGNTRDFKKQFRNIILDIIPIGIDKYRKSIRIGSSFIAPFFIKALKNGYLPGEHVLGGMYALHYKTLLGLKEIGFFNSVNKKYRGLTLEDILISLGVKALGHKLIDINVNKNNPITWLQYKPPIPLEASEILRKGIMAVHPLKNNNQGNEFRAVFENWRNNLCKPKN